METQQTSPTRPGTPGLDVFTIAGRSISGFGHSFKTGDSRRVRQPFTSRLEEQLAIFLEYHPPVRFYQRGDASPACATAYGLVTDLGTPYRINYVFEGKAHEYLPDFVGTLCDGGLFLAEAARESEKSQGKALGFSEIAIPPFVILHTRLVDKRLPVCQRSYHIGQIMMRFILERVANREWPVLRDRQPIGVRKLWADVATRVAFDQGMIFKP